MVIDVVCRLILHLCTYLEMVVKLCVDEKVVDDGGVDDLELRAQRDHDGGLHQQGEGREGNRRVTGL